MIERPAGAVFIDLPEGWEKKVTEMFEQGCSDVEAFVSLKVNKRDHEKMFRELEEYRDVFENGMAISEAYWMGWARSQMKVPSKDVNTKIFEKFMQRLFDWDKKIEKGGNGEKLKKEATKKEVDKFAGKYIKIAK